MGQNKDKPGFNWRFSLQTRTKPGLKANLKPGLNQNLIRCIIQSKHGL